MSDTKKRNPRCPNGTRKNPKTGNCEPVVEVVQEPEVAVVQEPVAMVVQEPVAVVAQEPVAIKSVKNKTKRCSNGTRLNKKTGVCEEIRPPSKIQKRIKITEKFEKPIDVPSDAPLEEINMEDAPHIKEVKLTGPVKMDVVDNKESIGVSHEESEYNEELANPDTTYDFLYPTLNDPNFNIKIARRKEFFNTKYDGTIYDIKEQSEKMCNASFELMPHQLFVKNFLSFQTPYNSLLLYQSLGTGKTCSAIGIAEENRRYMKQVGIKQRIIVVASPNVQANFRLQLFDDRKLKKISGSQSSGIISGEQDMWNIESCIGNSLLQEINPANLKGLSKEKIISQINSIINNFYVFMGYGQLANYITEKTRIDDKVKYTDKERTEIETKKIRQTFNNRLIIVDEVHNIRLTDENNNKKAAVLLMKVAKHAQNLRLLFLSATPMYNSYKEIIWLTNLLNLNDKRSTIDLSDVFDKQGEFKPPSTDTNAEGGQALLKRKLTGYVSYVRGANPYTFPYRIYPELFSPSHTFTGQGAFTPPTTNSVGDLRSPEEFVEGTTLVYPTIQMNGKPIDKPLKHVNVYVNVLGNYQKKAYSIVIENLRKKSFSTYNAYGDVREMPSFENMESFGYTLLQGPLEVLNIVYPNVGLDSLMENKDKEKDDDNTSTDDIKEESGIIAKSIGSHGLENVMKWETITKPMPMRIHFEYKNSAMKKYGRIFEREHLHKYSAKIANICKSIQKSTGIVLIYSQYIDGGAVPIALALEEMGITRYCSHSQHNKPLFKKSPTAPVDARTMKPGQGAKNPTTNVIGDRRSPETFGVKGSESFSPAKYIMITGDKAFSPTNAEDIKYATNTDNRYGEKVKVIIISKAGSEGLDFKNIRQIHVLEPWYNMNRIEQIIGRGVRNLSHCALPFEERNVEIYLHGTLLEKKDDSSDTEEAADLYVYRLAEKKAKQIGKVTRILKETSVDCILNVGQTNFTVDNLLEIAENQQIKQKLSSGKIIDYRVGDQPYTDICDYMDTCEYTCSPSSEINKDNLIEDTYNLDYVKMNNGQIVEKIRNLFKENVFYERNVLIDAINITKHYPIEQIFYALTFLIKNKNEYLVDRYGRTGNLVNKGNYYVFQPIEITDENISIYERTAPVDYKRDGVALEIPKEIQKVAEVKDDAEDAVLEGEPQEKNSHETIINTITEKFQTAFSNQRVLIETGEKNWYKHASRVMEHLQIVYKVPLDNIKTYVFEHIMDMMLLPDKLVLISYIYSIVDLSGFSPIEIGSIAEPQSGVAIQDSTSRIPVRNQMLNEIKKYFNKRLMVQGNTTAIVLNKENSWKIFIKPMDDELLWSEGEPEDYKIFEKQLDKFDVADDKINNLVGFINMFKMKEMVFKIKDVRQARNNTGARCGDSTTKSDAIKLANTMIGSNVYDNKTDILLFGLCVIIEVLARYFTEIKKDDKVYFLTPEETAINDIVHFTR